MCARAVSVTMMRKTRRAEGELRGCFAKAARASLSFCCAVDEVFPIRTREKREIFRKRAKKEILSKSFLFAEVILRWFLPPSVCDLILGQKVAASLKFYDDESVGTIWLVS